MQEKTAATNARAGKDPRTTTPGCWRDAWIVLTHQDMPMETAHGDRRQASNLLKTLRGGSAQYGLLGLYCFQMEELTFALVRLALELIRVLDELLLHTDAARLGAHALC